MVWDAQGTRSGAFFHVAFLFTVTVVLVTAQLGMAVLDVYGYLLRLVWIGSATGWSLRMLYLADKEPEASRQRWLARRGGLLIANLMAAGVFLSTL